MKPTASPACSTQAQPVFSDEVTRSRLDRRATVIVFLAFAAAYFCSALLRAIVATLSPVLAQEFSLGSGDLGLLGGGYFFGFAVVQLPLGGLLDRHGPKRVILCFLSMAVLGCLAFSASSNFAWLLAARVLVGMGAGACLMAPLTGYRRWFDVPTQLRANSWMLMTGSLGMLASTLPVQWLLPSTGWRPLFWLLASLLMLAMLAIARLTPGWPDLAPGNATGTKEPAVNAGAQSSYRSIWRSRYFRRMLPITACNYGGMIAVQTLWAGPWMVKVAQYTPLQAATGLFYINAAMLGTFWSWGMLNPWLAQKGWPAERLIAWLTPLSLMVLAVNIWGGGATGWPGWALFCVAASVMGLAQPAVGMAFHPRLAGRALSGFNLGLFSGVFLVQWGIGLLVDTFAGAGLTPASSFQAAMGVYLCCCIASYAYFLGAKADNSPQ